MIVFSAMRELIGEEYWKIFTVDTSTNRIQELPTPSRIECTDPLWSPNRKFIAFTGSERAVSGKPAIHLHDTTSSTTVQITTYQRFLSAIGWKSDSSQIITYMVIENDEQLLSVVDTITYTSSVLDNITGYWSFALTPSADKLAYVPQNHLSYVYIKSVGDVSSNILVDEPFNTPRNLGWSPNEQYISFTTSDDTDEDTILNVVEVASGVKRQAFGIPYDFHYAWSPDCTRLAYIGTKENNYALHILDVRTGTTTYLVTLNSGDEPGVMKPSNPAWSSDSSQIAIGSFEKDEYFALLLARVGISMENITVVNIPPFSLLYNLHWY